MAVRVNKSAFNIREKINELTKRFGLKGSELAAAETVQKARDLVSAGRKNLMFNGAMNIAQRGTIESSVTATAFSPDRYKFNLASLGTWTIEQHASGPAEFNNSFKLTCTSSNASPTANAAAFISYIIEAQDLQSLKYGTSEARDMTISFWVQSNKVGDATFIMLQNDNSNKLFNSKYTIHNANTWEYKTITIPGDTTGLFNDDNGEGLQVEWWLDGGSTFIGGDETNWRSFDNTYRNPNNLELGRTDDNYFSITGIQLEVGKNATDFEYRSHGEELALCQRYYYRKTSFSAKPMWIYSTSAGSTQIEFPTEMRSAPTFSYDGTLNTDILVYYGPITNYVTLSSLSGSTVSPQCCRLNFSTSTSLTNGYSAGLYTGSNGYLNFSAEF